jgi:uncharacterized lipoprotein YajG
MNRATIRITFFLLLALVMLDGCKRQPPPTSPTTTVTPMPLNSVSLFLPADVTAVMAAETGESACQAQNKRRARLVSATPQGTGTRYIYECLP